MGNNTNPRVVFNCDYCGKESSDRHSHYKKKKRHFCSISCYSLFRKECLPKEEHNAFGHGFLTDERNKRKKARSILNHGIRDGKIKKMPCEVCGNKNSEAHHEDYNNPLNIQWLCFKHHRQLHGHKVYENPELLNT